MKDDNFGYRPTPEQPLLIGLLVDVSGSMMSSIKNRQGRSSSRIESFRDALNDLVEKAKEMSRVGSSEKVAPLIKIFAYAFGFGNPLAFLFGGRGPQVRDLLALPGESSSTISIDKLANQWTYYRRHVEDMASEMFGNTPMREGFREAFERFNRELRHGKFTGQPVLFVLSDGEPTDASPNEIIRVAEAIKHLGVSIISCYVTSEDIAEPRYIYGSEQKNWPSGAKLMFECASILDNSSSFYSYLQEYDWTIENNGHFFTQINQSEILSEFMNAVLSPMKETEKKYKENAMIETVAIPILLKAVDFLFGEGSKILEERRKRLAKKQSSLKVIPPDQGSNAIISREEALKEKIEETVWESQQAKVTHLMTLLETYSQNYYLAREKYARFGRDHVPQVVVHQITEAEDEITSISKDLRDTLSQIYGKKVHIPEIEKA